MPKGHEGATRAPKGSEGGARAPKGRKAAARAAKASEVTARAPNGCEGRRRATKAPRGQRRAAKEQQTPLTGYGNQFIPQFHSMDDTKSFPFLACGISFYIYVDDTQCPAIRFHPPVRFVLNEMGSRTLLIPIQDCVHNRLRIGIHLSHSSAANWGAQGLRRNREDAEGLRNSGAKEPRGRRRAAKDPRGRRRATKGRRGRQRDPKEPRGRRRAAKGP